MGKFNGGCFLCLCFLFVFWLLIGLFIVSRCHGEERIIEPKTVYIEIEDDSEIGYPDGKACSNGLTFNCYLLDQSNGWTKSEPKTSADPDFSYLIGGECGEMHHIAVQCGNFHHFQWQADDRLIIEVIDVEEPFFGVQSTFLVILDEHGEQILDTTAIRPVLTSAKALRLVE